MSRRSGGIRPAGPAADDGDAHRDHLIRLYDGASPRRVVAPEAWREAQRVCYDRCREQVASLLEEPDRRLADDEPLVVLRFRLAADPA